MRCVTERPITVLRGIDRLNVGGPAIHAVLTTRGLDRARFRTVLVIGNVEPGEADMSYLLDETGVKCVVIPTLGRELRPLRDLKTLWQLWRVIRRERPQIIHTHKAKAGALGRFAALLAGVPIRVHTYHGHVFHGYFSPMKTQFFLVVERLLAKVSSKLVALSQTLVKELSETYRIAPAEKFSIVPLGFDLAPFSDCEARHRGELRRTLGVGAETRLVGIVGRMVPVKDHATFVAAAARLLQRRDDVEFVFIGGGELEGELRADVERRGLIGKMHFLGWQRHLERLYPDLDVVALSSVNEGTPVALIEAMCSGVPVVATRVGGVADLLGQGERGELVPVKDPNSLADGIDRSLTREARDRAMRIRREVIEQFGERRLCADLERIYENLLRQARVIT